jgi:uncharacterized repeat protein (TIGR01451 family)
MFNKEKNSNNLYLADTQRKFRARTRLNSKKLIFGLFVLAVVSGMLLGPFSVAKATSPRFNIYTPYTCTLQYNRDYFLICVKNDTKGTGYSTSVSADPGDTLTFSVYYHNGVNNTAATNTKLRVAIPSGTASTQTVSAYLWADNAENATAASPISFSNTINISSPQTLQFISGSAQWFPNQKSPLSDAPAPFLFGQSGNEIIGSGVNVGDIEGCWEFSGMVNFKVKISEIVQNADLNIAKTVRNITKNESSFSDSTSANQGDRVAFNLKIDSIGNAAAQNVIVSDQLPGELSYAAGTTRVDGSLVADGIISGGINLGAMSQGTTHNITFEATVNANSSASVTNYGFVKADNVSQKQDTAKICIKVVAQNANLTIAKTVKNVTNGEVIFSESTNAQEGDKVQFNLKISSTGEAAAQNVMVSDSLPYQLSYVAGSTKVDGSSVADGITSGGINIGNMNVSTSHNVIFDATVNLNSTISLTNTGYAQADNVSQKQDTACVKITEISRVKDLTIVKQVRNVTDTIIVFADSTNAKPRQTLEFSIKVTSTGNVAIDNVVVRDVLPDRLLYVAGSTYVNGFLTSDGVTSNGINIGTMNAGVSKTITFRVNLEREVLFPRGETTLINTAYGRADEVAEKSDTAQVIVTYTGCSTENNIPANR